MHTSFEMGLSDKLRPRPEGPVWASKSAGLDKITIARGSAMFEAGDRRQAYRICSGAICQCVRWPDGRIEVIDFAFPGDFSGLGYLPIHTTSSVAMVDTVAVPVSAEQMDVLFANDDELALKLADAGEREFDLLRSKSRIASLLPPVQKLARYLLAIIAINTTEGRAATLTSDEVSSRHVADILQLAAEDLAMALLSLRRRGFLDVSGNGWRVVDPAGLETLADGA